MKTFDLFDHEPSTPSLKLCINLGRDTESIHDYFKSR